MTTFFFSSPPSTHKKTELNTFQSAANRLYQYPTPKMNVSISINTACIPSTMIASPVVGVSLAAVPHFDKSNFQRWLREWKNYSIANRFADALNAGETGTYPLRVLQGTTIVDINAAMTPADVVNIGLILLAALPEDLKQQYEDKLDRFPSAKSIVADLKDKYEGENDLMAAKILWGLPSIRFTSLEDIEIHLTDFMKMMDDVQEAGCTLTERTKTDLLSRTINIPVLKATIEAELSQKRTLTHLVSTIERAIRRFLENHQQQTSRPTETALSVSTMRCYNCQQIGHLRAECRNRRVRVPRSFNSPKKRRCFVMKSLVAEMPEDASAKWIVDSGASMHMTHNPDNFLHKQTIETVTIEATDGKTMSSTIKGVVDFGTFQLKDVHLFPQLKFNLVSVATAARCGVKTVFNRLQAIFKDSVTKEPITVANLNLDSNTYTLIKRPIVKKTLVTLHSKQDIWHSRLGHPNRELTERMIREFNLTNNPETIDCIQCALGNFNRSRYPAGSIETTRPLQRLHLDLISGPSVSLRGI